MFQNVWWILFVFSETKVYTKLQSLPPLRSKKVPCLVRERVKSNDFFFTCEGLNEDPSWTTNEQPLFLCSTRVTTPYDPSGLSSVRSRCIPGRRVRDPPDLPLIGSMSPKTFPVETLETPEWKLQYLLRPVIVIDPWVDCLSWALPLWVRSHVKISVYSYRLQQHFREVVRIKNDHQFHLHSPT